MVSAAGFEPAPETIVLTLSGRRSITTALLVVPHVLGIAAVVRVTCVFTFRYALVKGTPIQVFRLPKRCGSTTISQGVSDPGSEA